MEDDAPLARALEQRGARVTAAIWDDPTARWENFDIVIPRTTWDYHLKPREFERWIERCAKRLINPPEVLRWNMSKQYLRDLEAQGIPTIPTRWFETPRPKELIEWLEAKKTNTEWILKPAISAGAHQTIRLRGGTRPHDLDPDSRATLDALCMEQSLVLGQEFLPSIVAQGERSLFFFGEKLTHAVIKIPRPGDFRVQPNYGGTTQAITPDPEIVALSQKALMRVPGNWRYARVDWVEASGSKLIEIELIEPNLFIAQDPSGRAADEFAEAILSDRATIKP